MTDGSAQTRRSVRAAGGARARSGVRCAVAVAVGALEDPDAMVRRTVDVALDVAAVDSAALARPGNVVARARERAAVRRPVRRARPDARPRAPPKRLAAIVARGEGARGRRAPARTPGADAAGSA